MYAPIWWLCIVAPTVKGMEAVGRESWCVYTHFCQLLGTSQSLLLLIKLVLFYWQKKKELSSSPCGIHESRRIGRTSKTLVQSRSGWHVIRRVVGLVK